MWTRIARLNHVRLNWDEKAAHNWWNKDILPSLMGWHRCYIGGEMRERNGYNLFVWILRVKRQMFLK